MLKTAKTETDTLNPLDFKRISPRKAINIIKLKSNDSFFVSLSSM